MFKRKYDLFILGVFCLFIILAILAPIVFTMQTTNEQWNFKETGPIGDTIGGTAGPILSLLASILVFFSFREQYTANERIAKQQANDRNFQVMLRLIEQLKQAIDKAVVIDGISKIFHEEVIKIMQDSFNPMLANFHQDLSWEIDQNGNRINQEGVYVAHRDKFTNYLQRKNDAFSQLYLIIRTGSLIIDKLQDDKFLLDAEEKNYLEITFLLYCRRLYDAQLNNSIRTALLANQTNWIEYIDEIVLKSDFLIKYNKIHFYYDKKMNKLY